MRRFISGGYAASLIMAGELSEAIVEPIDAPRANGGKRAYAPGVDVSNAASTAASGHIIVQYSVFRASDAASMTAYWHNYDAERLVPGLGDQVRAHIDTGQGWYELYVLKALEVLRLKVDVVGATRTADQVNQMYRAIAQAITARTGLP